MYYKTEPPVSRKERKLQSDGERKLEKDMQTEEARKQMVATLVHGRWLVSGVISFNFHQAALSFSDSISKWTDNGRAILRIYFKISL